MGCSVWESRVAEIQSQVKHQQRRAAGFYHAARKHGSAPILPTEMLDPDYFRGRTEMQSWGAQSWAAGMVESEESH